MTMIDRWPFAPLMPSAVVKFWGDRPRARRMLRPIITETCGDGHAPDAWRRCLLPPEADLTIPGSSEERDILGQAVVLRNSVILRERPSRSDRCLLHGYERIIGDESAGFLLPDLTLVDRVDLRDPWVPPVIRKITASNIVLSAGIAIGLELDHSNTEQIREQIQNETPGATASDRMAGFIMAIIVRDLRVVDPYRAWGGALNAAYPALRELAEVTPLQPVLDASVLLNPPAGPSETNAITDLCWVLHQLHVQGLPS